MSGGREPFATLTRQAERDLDEVWSWIRRESGTDRADAFVREIMATARVFAARPSAGRPQPELEAGLRSFLVRPYLVYYLPKAWGLEVVRILHTRRDRNAAWRDEPGAAGA